MAARVLQWVGGLAVVALIVGTGVAVTGLGSGNGEGERSFSFLAGSEKKAFEPVIRAYCADQGWDCQFHYAGSVDIKLALEEQEDFAHDVVAPAHSRWIEMGDSRRRVTDVTSVAVSPVAFGIRRDKAEALGLIDRPVTIAALLDLVRDQTLTFLMSNPTQSNSGFSAYMGFLRALDPSGDLLTLEDLNNASLRAGVRDMLGGITRTSGSSGWLADLYVEAARRETVYDAMVNYEAVLLDTNRQLEALGQAPLYLIYPADGTALADNPVGFVTRDRPDAAERKAFYDGLLAWLGGPEVRARLETDGWRTGVGGAVASAAARAAFNPAWGATTDPVPVVRFPDVPVINAALELYQTTLRRPTLLALCLDDSGSMQGAGHQQLLMALERIFDPAQAGRLLLRPHPRDQYLVFTFNAQTTFAGQVPGTDSTRVIDIARAMKTSGNTDFNRCTLQAAQAVKTLAQQPDYADHLMAVSLMTDGQLSRDIALPLTAVQTVWQGLDLDLPVHTILFGAAAREEVAPIAEATLGRVFDGREDLAEAFRDMRGYQ